MAATTATNHWKLGLFVLISLFVMIAALFWLGARRFQRTSFPAVTYFDESVQGLDVGSPVKFRGGTSPVARFCVDGKVARHERR